MEITIGTEIYYHGDIVNRSGFGVVVAEYEGKYCPPCVDIKMDDGRILKRVSKTGFKKEYEGHGGTRFVTKDAYDRFQKQMQNYLMSVAKRRG